MCEVKNDHLLTHDWMSDWMRKWETGETKS